MLNPYLISISWLKDRDLIHLALSFMEGIVLLNEEKRQLGVKPIQNYHFIVKPASKN